LQGLLLSIICIVTLLVMRRLVDTSGCKLLPLRLRREGAAPLPARHSCQGAPACRRYPMLLSHSDELAIHLCAGLACAGVTTGRSNGILPYVTRAHCCNRFKLPLMLLSLCSPRLLCVLACSETSA
jgi:hypothetical protein